MKKQIFKEVKLDREDQDFLVSLSGKKEFERLSEIIDMILGARLWGVVASNMSREEKAEELANIEGGHDLWRYLKSLIKKSEDNIKQNEETK